MPTLLFFNTLLSNRSSSGTLKRHTVFILVHSYSVWIKANALNGMSVNEKHLLTSIKVSMRFIGAQEHGLAWIQNHVIEEVDGEAANVSRILRV